MNLTVTHIRKTFQNNGASKTILRDVSFAVESGQFVSLVGPSGCGKSTLLTIIAGFQESTAGEIRLNGGIVSRPGPDRGFVFQEFALFPWMTVRENILFPMKQMKIPRPDQTERLQKLLSMAQLEDSEHLYPSQISGGMKQRTAVLRALAGDPQVLLMDEPLGAVDHQMRQILQEELEALWMKNPTTVIMVTHDIEEAIYLSDRVLVMSAQKGQIVRELSIDLERPRIRTAPCYLDYKNQLTDVLTADRNDSDQRGTMT